MREYFCLLSLYLKIRWKPWKELFALLSETNAKFIKKCVRLPMKRTCVQGAGLVVVLDKHTSGLKYEEDVFLLINVGTWVIKMCNAQSLCCWWVYAYAHKQLKHAPVHDHHFADASVVYVCFSKIRSQRFRAPYCPWRPLCASWQTTRHNLLPTLVHSWRNSV